VIPDAEPTNNRAERTPRSSVIHRKIFGGSRSEKEAEIYTRVHSTYYKSKLREKTSSKILHPLSKEKLNSVNGIKPHQTDQLNLLDANK
jgi:hypothetical protein